MAADQAPLHGGSLTIADTHCAASKWRTGAVAAPILGTHHPRFRRFRATRRLHSFQSRQAPPCLACPRLAFFLVSPICARRTAAGGLGRRTKSGSRGLRRTAQLTRNSLRSIRATKRTSLTPRAPCRRAP